MPQLSLYVDDDTLKKVAKAAKLENKSISKWVSSKIKSSLSNSWPEDWFSLFGSIYDESFGSIIKLEFKNDSEREFL
ncbi:MAG: toxin-antitoxin system, antitoxin component [Ignavibacteriae bacterium]|nr:toxin-antitoxin system, antitoxin component [Ignavibacteriota bacterium]